MLDEHITCGSGCPHNNKSKFEVIDRVTCCAVGLEDTKWQMNQK